MTSLDGINGSGSMSARQRKVTVVAARTRWWLGPWRMITPPGISIHDTYNEFFCDHMLQSICINGLSSIVFNSLTDKLTSKKEVCCKVWHVNPNPVACYIDNCEHIRTYQIFDSSFNYCHILLIVQLYFLLSSVPWFPIAKKLKQMFVGMVTCSRLPPQNSLAKVQS